MIAPGPETGIAEALSGLPLRLEVIELLAAGEDTHWVARISTGPDAGAAEASVSPDPRTGAPGPGQLAAHGPTRRSALSGLAELLPRVRRLVIGGGPGGSAVALAWSDGRFTAVDLDHAATITEQEAAATADKLAERSLFPRYLARSGGDPTRVLESPDEVNLAYNKALQAGADQQEVGALRTRLLEYLAAGGGA